MLEDPGGSVRYRPSGHRSDPPGERWKGSRSVVEEACGRESRASCRCRGGRYRGPRTGGANFSHLGVSARGQRLKAR